MPHRVKDILWLAGRDYRNEWQMSAFFIISLAAVLGPMMILYGLKFGIVGSMLTNLIEDPRNREVRPIGSGRYDSAWVEQLRNREEIDFIVPRTRAIAATIDLKSETASRIISVEMIPTGQADPLLKTQTIPQSLQQIVLSDKAAQKLNVKPGDEISGSLSRRFKGHSERVYISLQVIDIAKPGSFTRDGAFTDLLLVEAAEDFRDGRAVSALGWSGTAEGNDKRTYPSFRLYTSSIYDVAPISEALGKLGIEVSTRVADIDIVRTMDRNLSVVFWLIAIIGLFGFTLSLGASLWANVDRKKKELSVLRLVGFRTGEIVWFPVLQSAFTAIFGWLTASMIYLGVSFTINRLFASQMDSSDSICRLLPNHFLITLILTLGAATIAAILAGYRAARIEPSEGLRDI
ncbi:MAG: FtsX-like permease family protein [Candidatus Thiodiazotropha sp. (ex Lucinoma aequizonata)]|nr:FtsX-like permease family protein [Candidatus Thiodiazotropha sp. (ex Lucinoma aequizonata)]MCU7887860.1 FtsX-like permease family protein [Candidatus Thiodiazotropha sp. (ex Lucinoma aequizonata)]MCU7895395.1 FtsX-like permease family protein [Candidatus Thiodiazotropha sp. (ex Lucinoma aequizonata)]MCU7900404.1 FtsX-like permease family protein [Candidatus Thiodiazotropha sp. (ex Lucinoma aequizonata)]MCU7901966.1 FtsX-like permease family protein [Candidatus Thiodiazotropha sp. (ex Lucino